MTETASSLSAGKPAGDSKSQNSFAPTEPSVQLLNFFHQPYNNAVATARTCYSSKVIYPEDVTATEDRKTQRDRIAASIYKAGHHTTLQHASFQFVLERVSRQFIWSFLHAHPFYNSEQVSQRYVEVKPGNYYIPRLKTRARGMYLEAIERQEQAYRDLIQILGQPVQENYLKIFPKRDPDRKDWQRAMKKRAMEIARYVLPVATFAHLYHTISGITLHRYHRLCHQMDVPRETRAVVARMIEEVLKIDPDFHRNLEDPLDLEETLEYQALQNLSQEQTVNEKHRQQFLEEFDASLQNQSSKLLGFHPQAQSNLAQGVRSILGLPQDQLSDAEAIACILNPDQNPYLSESLNLASLSKLMRPMHHCHFTFRKKISHTADSQDQRHRMTPGSRPLLEQHFIDENPDYITPPLIHQSEQAITLYDRVMEQTWQSIHELLQEGVERQDALYLLPNAFPIRFEESGDLAAFHHKWTTRLCYTAQEEIWNNCRDEVLQVNDIYPEIGKWLHPPCTLRFMAKQTPYCPEGDRFCGVRVWKMPVQDFDRLL